MQDIERLRNDFDGQGFARVSGLMDPFLPAIHEVKATHPTYRTMAVSKGRYEQPRRQIPMFEDICRDASLLETVEGILGSTVCYFKDKLICKPRGANGYQPHRDIDFGWRHFITRAVTVVVPFDAMTTANGCLEMLPGSHVTEHPKSGWITMELKLGEVLIFDAMTLHRSKDNDGQSNRTAYFITYNDAKDGDRSADYYEWMRDYPDGVRQSDVLGNQTCDAK